MEKRRLEAAFWDSRRKINFFIFFNFLPHFFRAGTAVPAPVEQHNSGPSTDPIATTGVRHGSALSPLCR